ncbi:MAG: helix-turn-helix transcriptional regulator [Planctomycetes bacterium]|nr:helix-turn-helix transcriptional regulator [Planctomycetota bacterium]
MRKPHTHSELEINLVLKGQARYLVNGRPCDLAPRSMLWLFPDQDHLLVNASHDFCMWIAVWRQSLIKRTVGSGQAKILRESSPPGHFCRIVSREDFGKLHGLFHDLAGWDLDCELADSGLAYLLMKAWNIFEKTEPLPPAEEVHPAVAKAARILQEDDASIQVDELAGRAGLSRSQLSRLFHKQTGVTLVEFRNRRRIDKFLQLYGTGQRINMLQAAYDSGFGSYAQFHRIFKEVMGMGPSEYRRSL